jgi:hypothetical protein
MKQILAAILLISLVSVSTALAQTAAKPLAFDAELLVSNGRNQDEESVNVRFGADEVVIFSKEPGVTKTLKYADIKSAEYTYSKKPRYKTGAILAATISVFLLPIMFTKTKKHWLTLQTENDFAVLKLKKSSYRMVLPAFESHGVKVANLGNQNKGDKDTDGK